eukprot:TRINITY_DN40640_c0_g1_i1.p1 TRINITY_DN40640_c0_g1~~TRINITY_DN40640_c0_g1_i1.p1  ORF type:complete len:427 (+),score=224.92 TRINITY_DN40640_c0_g1_i1:156-1283(+)
MGKVPVLQTEQGPLFEATAIAHYVASLNGDKKNLLPKDAFAAAELQQWISFASMELNLPFAVWIYPVLGYAPFNKGAYDKAKMDADRAMTALNAYFLKKTFIVGERITLADIVLFCQLLGPYTLVLDTEAQKKYQNVTRWFKTMLVQPEFKKACGPITLATEEKQAEKGASKKNQPKKEKKEKKEQPKKEKKVEEEKPSQEETEANASEKSQKQIMEEWAAGLPKSTLVFDEWKRFYSNNKMPAACKWFWENFDAAGYSLWFCNFKYNDENEQLFKTCNLAGGFITRTEFMRKYAFANMLINGVNNNNQLSGVWMFPGDILPPPFLTCDDTELYDWRKIDPTNEDDKELVNTYWSWEGKFPEGIHEECVDGKTFK